jgi:hypothetical protein
MSTTREKLKDTSSTVSAKADNSKPSKSQSGKKRANLPPGNAVGTSADVSAILQADKKKQNPDKAAQNFFQGTALIDRSCLDK